jgi:hypothetical protein
MVVSPAGLGTKNDCAGEASRNLHDRPAYSAYCFILVCWMSRIILDLENGDNIFPETSVAFYQTTRREDITLYSRLKPNMSRMFDILSSEQ